MKRDSSWDCGTEIFVQGIGRCTCYRRTIKGEFYQFKIKHVSVTVIGEPSYSNREALADALIELKKKFESYFSKH